jgi:hypothetical protein
MSAISKLNASWLSVAQENTLALANAHFDFSLIKFESPPEFRGLGAALTSNRRTVAEDGHLHVVARKLGALFEHVLPKTSILIKKYGTRVSEIAAKPNVNPVGTLNDGAFRDHIGADGTSIWAAATSGNSAIGVHLLACMLARVWSGPEAISIWLEIVEARKKELLRIYEKDPSSLASLSAAQISLTKEQLASWDASARAWLESADKAMARRHTQLMLIANNVCLPVSQKLNVYDGVISALETAAKTVEKIICGEPHSIQDGATLLGLGAWHLYPDMLVLGKSPVPIVQEDGLVEKGGRLTIGLRMASSRKNHGVSWSLPLAHLRYYGNPVVTTRTMANCGTNLPFDFFLQVALGTAVSTWSKYDIPTSNGIQAINMIYNYILPQNLHGRTSTGNDSTTMHWLAILARAAEEFEKAEDEYKQMYRRLVDFGRRQGASLGNHSAHPTPIFGLSSCNTFFSLLKGDEERIRVLRNFANSIDADFDELVIKYRVTQDNPKLNRTATWEYASAKLIPYPLNLNPASRTHVRWMRLPEILSNITCKCEGDCGEFTCACSGESSTCTRECSCRGSMCWNPFTNPQLLAYTDYLKERVDTVREAENEIVLDLDSQRVEKTEDLIFQWLGYLEDCQGGKDSTNNDAPKDISPTWHDPNPPMAPAVTFKIIFGASKTAGLYQKQPMPVRNAPRTPFTRLAGVDSVLFALQNKVVSPDLLAEHMHKLGLLTKGNKKTARDGQIYYESLSGLAMAADIYSRLPDSIVSLGSAIMRPLAEATWVKHWLQRSKGSRRVERVSKNEAFACIVMFDTGRLDLRPSLFEKVMAVSSRNSLYVAAKLLCDPWTLSEPADIRRLIGNVGRSGLLLLVPPPNPSVRPKLVGHWNQINHAPFEGRVEDTFQGTSLHLSFTEAETPLDLDVYGDRTAEAFYVESLVSVHDRGEWIADLDILGMFERASFKRLPSGTTCAHKPSGHGENSIDSPCKLPLTTVGSWDEFLDPPTGISVVMSHQNWLARLAIAVIAVQRGDDVHALGLHHCWQCTEVILSTRMEELRESVGGTTIPTSDQRHKLNFGIGTDDSSEDEIYSEDTAEDRMSEIDDAPEIQASLGSMKLPYSPKLKRSSSSDEFKNEHSSRRRKLSPVVSESARSLSNDPEDRYPKIIVVA